MPEHVLMSEIGIITDGGHRRCWTAAEKLPIVEETRDDRASISVVARRNRVAANLLFYMRTGSGATDSTPSFIQLIAIPRTGLSGHWSAIRAA